MAISNNIKSVRPGSSGSPGSSGGSDQDKDILPTPNFNDVRGSIKSGLASQKELVGLQHTYKVASAKIKMQSALSRSLTRTMEEIARYLA